MGNFRFTELLGSIGGSHPSGELFLDFLRRQAKYDPENCSKKQATFQRCMACCQADACHARGGTANPCRTDCMHTSYFQLFLVLPCFTNLIN